MIEFYTPDEWLTLFGGSPSLVIDDDGYIYTYEESNKIIGRTPCGKVDFKAEVIYGKDYNDFIKFPIAYIRREDNVIRIFSEEPQGMFCYPFLYIVDNEVYTADEYNRVFRGSPSGYIKGGKPPKPDDSGDISDDGSGSLSGGSFVRGRPIVWLLIIIMLISVLVNIQNKQGPVVDAGTIVTFIVLTTIMFGIRLWRQTKKKETPEKTDAATKKAPATKKPPATEKTDADAVLLESIDGKLLFQCPHCASKMYGPTGKGKITLICPKCKAKLSAKT